MLTHVSGGFGRYLHGANPGRIIGSGLLIVGAGGGGWALVAAAGQHSRGGTVRAPGCGARGAAVAGVQGALAVSGVVGLLGGALTLALIRPTRSTESVAATDVELARESA
jgi:hypothetical protein